jgi:t-SNARE complex subunit (syntaxin)
VIQGGIDRNKAIRGQAQESETAIKLIERSIMKRKLMFGSLLVAFAVSVIIVLIVKISKG